jgi:uncharacterized protein YbjQ (UPF0145 family)/ribosomal protein L40E
MKRCLKCDSQNPDTARFCASCGHEFAGTELAADKVPCPKCHFENEAGAVECLKCGVVFAKYVPTAQRPGVITHDMTSTTFELPGHQVMQNLGVVRGIVVRSRSVVGTLGASLQTLVGGDITLFTELCENTRNDAFERMVKHASERGANAVIGIRYDATEVMQGVTEVLAYGTAVVVKAD